MKVKIKIYPSFGVAYEVIIFVSKDNLEMYIEDWIDDNLKNVEEYEIYQ